jgi:hypothetical protein
MTYLDFLRKLLALGPKLPDVFESVQRIIAEVQTILRLVKGEEPLFGESPMELNATEQAAEGEVLAAMAGSSETFGGIGDGAILRSIFAFLQANPELLQLILTLLKL